MEQETDSYDLTPAEAKALIAEQRLRIRDLEGTIWFVLQSADRHAAAARSYAGKGFTAADEAKRERGLFASHGRESLSTDSEDEAKR